MDGVNRVTDVLPMRAVAGADAPRRDTENRKNGLRLAEDIHQEVRWRGSLALHPGCGLAHNLLQPLP